MNNKIAISKNKEYGSLVSLTCKGGVTILTLKVNLIGDRLMAAYDRALRWADIENRLRNYRWIYK